MGRAAQPLKIRPATLNKVLGKIMAVFNRPFLLGKMFLRILGNVDRTCS